MKPWLTPEGSMIERKLRDGMELRRHQVRRRGCGKVWRLGFSPTDTVSPPAVEALLRRGLAVLGADGAIRHGGLT